jgi:hypothetical protein
MELTTDRQKHSDKTKIIVLQSLDVSVFDLTLMPGPYGKGYPQTP